jgi:hypothetical protein
LDHLIHLGSAKAVWMSFVRILRLSFPWRLGGFVSEIRAPTKVQVDLLKLQGENHEGAGFATGLAISGLSRE